MSQFNTFGAPPRAKVILKSSNRLTDAAYRHRRDLPRLPTPNGRTQSRKRTEMDAPRQHHSIKRARFMGLLPYTSATL